jgi:hypothetical protein
MKQPWPDNRSAMILRFIVVALLACAGDMAKAQDWGEVPEAQDWTRHFRLGPVVGLNLRADFKMDGQFNVSGGSQAGPTGVSGVDHVYDDGYVRVDDTGNAQGYTSYWGYQNASQYDPAKQTLTLRSSSSFNLTHSTHVDGGGQVGLDLVYGGKLMKSGDALVGWEFGFMWMPIHIKDTSELSTTFARTVHVFDTGDLVMPTAPYNGGPDGIGPTIRDIASPGPEETSPGTITGSRTLDVTLYNFRLGPSMHWEVNSWFAFSVGGGAALGLATCDYKFNETIQIADGGQTVNHGSFGDTEVVYGGYAGVTLMFHTIEKADIFIGAQFMMLDKVGVSSVHDAGQGGSEFGRP